MAWRNFDSTYESFQNTDDANARTAGTPELLGTTVCVPLHDAAAEATCTMIYKCEELVADKVTTADRGAIDAGEKVRVHLSGANAGKVEDDGGTLAADLVDCGFARETVVATDTQVRIRFNGEAGQLRA